MPVDLYFWKLECGLALKLLFRVILKVSGFLIILLWSVLSASHCPALVRCPFKAKPKTF